jgi:hypothetical protein
LHFYQHVNVIIAHFALEQPDEVRLRDLQKRATGDDSKLSLKKGFSILWTEPDVIISHFVLTKPRVFNPRTSLLEFPAQTQLDAAGVGGEAFRAGDERGGGTDRA